MQEVSVDVCLPENRDCPETIVSLNVTLDLFVYLPSLTQEGVDYLSIPDLKAIISAMETAHEHNTSTV